VAPFWLETVYRHLGAAGAPCILSVHEERTPIGMMALAIENDTACFLGSPDVCDYQDLISAPGRQAKVLESVIAHLAAWGIRQLDLRTLRPDAVMLDALNSITAGCGQAALSADEVTYEIPLPASWEDYLGGLDGKQRHEVRRKLRRLETRGTVHYRCVSDLAPSAAPVDTFLALFRRNRPDKAAFMSEVMEAYFRDQMHSLGIQGLLRIGILEVNAQPAAAVLCFDYRGVRYLYNSGYDEQFEPFSVGVVSKLLSIRDSIESGCRHYDFLKGQESYKRRIGGREVPLYRCLLPL